MKRRDLLTTGLTAGAGSSFLSGATPADSSLAKRLTAALDEVRLYDSHEHLMPENTRIQQGADFFTLAGHYAINDAISAGLSSEARAAVNDQRAPLDRRWKAFEPYWNAARFTGYGQALSIAIRDIYGVAEISGKSMERIDAAVRGENKAGLYRRVLKERARIDWCLVDANWNEKPARLDQDYFLLAQKFDGFITPRTRKDIDRLETISGVSIHSLADHKKAIESTFEQAVAIGMVAVKSTIAYTRDLMFAEVSEHDAAEDFESLLKGGAELPTGFRAAKQRPFRRLEDHMFHHLARLADAHGYPFQIHTGLLAGNACFIENTNPTQLTNLFYLYPRVKFDLLHISYPYQEELVVLAKLFPNVYADFCWAHVISPPASRRALDECLETVPVNKVMAFGGDYRFPELTYAHAQMARRNVAQVLVGKVEAGLFTEDQALEIGRLLLRENALAVFPPTRSSKLASAPSAKPELGRP